MTGEDEFLDRLYEAAALPELWPGVLDRLSAMADLAGAMLLGIRDTDVRWTSTPNFEATFRTYLQRGYVGQDQRTVRLTKLEYAGFVSELDVFSLEEWEADPIRRDLLVPAGFGWGIATNVAVPSGDTLIIHGERYTDQGPPPAGSRTFLDRLRPHLARATLLSSRLAFEKIAAAAMALEIVGIPAAVLDDAGRPLATNSLFDVFAPSIVQFRSARLALANKAADQRLNDILLALRAGLSVTQTQSIPIPAGSDHDASIAHLYPVRRQARDVFTGASVIMLLMPIRHREIPPAIVIQGLFDLTAAEAKVARAIGTGTTVEELASTTGVSVATIRSQLRAVFDKTGLNRQVELAGLLQGLRPGSA